MHEIGAYPVMRGRVSVEKRVSGGLSRSMSHMVYCPLCLGWRNMAMSRLQAPFPPHSQGLSTHGPPKAELFTQRNWPEEDRKTNRDQHKTKKLQDAPITNQSGLGISVTERKAWQLSQMIILWLLYTVTCMYRVRVNPNEWWAKVSNSFSGTVALDEKVWNKAALKKSSQWHPLHE